MQPNQPQRPVIDVTAPRRPMAGGMPPAPRPKPVAEPPAAPASAPVETPKPPASLPVHEAPKIDEVPAPGPIAPQQPAAAPATERPVPEQAPEPQETAGPAVERPQQPKNTPPLPVGAIVSAIFIMLILALIAVMVYLQA